MAAFIESVLYIYYTFPIDVTTNLHSNLGILFLLYALQSRVSKE
jgi:hypothetical protein